MKKYDFKQGSPEWLAARAGIVTASELDAIITPLWAVRKGEGVDTYLCKKLAERWLGQPLASFYGGAMEQGTIREDEARPYYEFTTGQTVEEVGFITTDDGKFGCSPDGLIGEIPGFASHRGLEIKCPEAHTHCKYLIEGKLPKDYAAQVHGSMAVTGASFWTFMSYCRNLPPFIYTVQRNVEIIEQINAAVSEFNIKLDAAYKRLIEINGGEPDRKRFKPMVTERKADPFDGVTVDQELLRDWMRT